MRHNAAMAVALVVVGVVIVFLLWRILRVQEARARVEVVQATAQVARDMSQAFAKGWEEARATGRLIEWVDNLARSLDIDGDRMWLLLRSPQGAELRALLIRESLERGVLCRFLEERDFADQYQGHPGPDPGRDAWCPNGCDQERDVRFTTELKVCPFCGRPVEALAEADDRSRWQAEMLAFERYGRLLPTRANADESQSLAAHNAAAERERAKLEPRGGRWFVSTSIA